jgi:LacI family transcriptional regulator
MALGVMSAAGHRGLRIPADIAVAGFDDSPGSRMVWPPLTSVHQPLEEMGARAVALLLDAHDANQNPLTHRLVLRGSTTGSLDVVTGTIDA